MSKDWGKRTKVSTDVPTEMALGDGEVSVWMGQTPDGDEAAMMR